MCISVDRTNQLCVCVCVVCVCVYVFVVCDEAFLQSCAQLCVCVCVCVCAHAVWGTVSVTLDCVHLRFFSKPHTRANMQACVCVYVCIFEVFLQSCLCVCVCIL